MASPRTREGQPRMNTNGHEWVVADPISKIYFKHAKWQWKRVTL